jgi:hypothetical protein
MGAEAINATRLMTYQSELENNGELPPLDSNLLYSQDDFYYTELGGGNGGHQMVVKTGGVYLKLHAVSLVNFSAQVFEINYADRSLQALFNFDSARYPGMLLNWILPFYLRDLDQAAVRIRAADRETFFPNCSRIRAELLNMAFRQPANIETIEQAVAAIRFGERNAARGAGGAAANMAVLMDRRGIADDLPYRSP